MRPLFRSLRPLCAAVLSAWLAGCAPTGPFNRLRDGVAGIPPTRGVLVFSSVKQDRHSIMWDYRIRSPDAVTGVLGREFRLPNGFYDLPCGRIGNMVAASLEPGTYEFGPWTLYVSVATAGAGFVINTTNHEEGPADARFSVELHPGRITYIGEVRVDQEANTAAITDQWPCDREYVERTWPSLVTWPVDRVVRQFPQPALGGAAAHP